MKNSVVLIMITFVAALNLSRGAEITIAYAADPVSLDPYEQISVGTLQMANMVYDPLLRYDSDLNIEPRLATSWENINPTTLRFHLRQGVSFHNGDPMSADDVVFSFDRMRRSTDFKVLLQPYVAMRKVDRYTVDLIMKQPYPLALANMTYLFVMNHKYFSGKDKKGRDKSRIIKAGDSFASTHENGTGAFMLKARQQGVKSIYQKYAGYWNREESGNVETIRLVPIKEDATRVSALISGDVDWISPVPATDKARVQKTPGLQIYQVPGDMIITLQMNQKVVPAFRDRRVRKAVVYAVNNVGIVSKIMRGNAVAAGQNSPPFYVGYNPRLKPRHDLEKARRLMREAGYAEGFTITMIAPNNRYVNDEKIASAVAAMLAKINIRVTLTTMPKARYFQEFLKCTAGMAMLSGVSDTGDSANYSEFLTMTKNPKTGTGTYNCGGFSNAELDQLVIASNSETDTEKRKRLLQHVSAIEYDQALFVPLHWENRLWAFKETFANFPECVNYKNIPLWDKLVVD